jgi:hypothetical protein
MQTPRTLAPDAPGARSASSKSTNTRKIRFRHVRINRMHARVTYSGPPITVKEFGLVLDTRVYRSMEGSWKTVLNRWGPGLVACITVRVCVVLIDDGELLVCVLAASLLV